MQTNIKIKIKVYPSINFLNSKIKIYFSCKHDSVFDELSHTRNYILSMIISFMKCDGKALF